jgi:DNA ligase (NAD+)
MLSLQNSYNAQELIDLDDFIMRQLKKSQEDQSISLAYTYIVEPKFDGISVEIVYKDGKLTKAVTRGD